MLDGKAEAMNQPGGKMGEGGGMNGAGVGPPGTGPEPRDGELERRRRWGHGARIGPQGTRNLYPPKYGTGRK